MKLKSSHLSVLAAVATGRHRNAMRKQATAHLLALGALEQDHDGSFVVTAVGWSALEEADIGLHRPQAPTVCRSMASACIVVFPLDRRSSLIAETVSRLLSMPPVRADAFWLALVSRLRRELTAVGVLTPEADRMLDRFRVAVDRAFCAADDAASTGGDAAA